MAASDDRRNSLPGGTVTLLFADVEGSTKLLYTLRERFAPARARMRDIVREAASRHGGHEVDWAGDGAFLAFSRARSAIVAAVEIQRTLGEEPWAPDEALRLRVGIHTGEPELGEEGYVGMEVVVAARICAATHGEQIVVTRATRDVAGDEPLPDAFYKPLGRHRLKDVPSAEQLFQLAAPGLREEFPPLRTLGATSLPALHHRLVGRREALGRIEALLERPDVRLVTITGPGGAGKSRLALEVAAEAALDRPVHLVGLAPASHSDRVPEAIARAIGVREAPGRPLTESIADTLHGTGALLFLDNLEHLAPAAVHVADLLDRAPDLDVLATSRVPLQLSGEHVLRLEPLDVEDAATLFIELAAARGVVLREDTLASVHDICRRLDGLPLAIELVAARLVVLPPAEILRALDEGLALDMEGPIDLPERQRTLRAAIDWSYRLLSPSQRELHGALAVFADGGALEDARTIARAGDRFLPDLEALVAWSLVRSDVSDGEVRLSMLETVREHAVACLRTEGELDDLKRRHAERFVELACAADAELAGPHQAVWLNRLEQEFDNIRAALDWCLSSDRVEDALRAIAALSRFWRARGHVTEARRWLSRGLSQDAHLSADVRADALWTAARQAAAQSDWEAATALLEEALPLFRDVGREREVVFTLSELAFMALRRNEPERAAVLCEEAVSRARELSDPRATSSALTILGEVRSAQGDHARALAHLEEAVAQRRKLGDALLVTDAVFNFGWVAFLAGDLMRSRAAFEESLALARELSDALHTAEALLLLGELDLLADDAEGAEARIRASLELYTDVGSTLERAACLTALGGVAVLRESDEEAARLFGEAEALRGEAPLEAPERAVVERFYPRVEAALGEERVIALKAEGAEGGHGADPVGRPA
ncbi:MAG TPA: tetratricopeptide repeat protein [Gaiellaceae bacterium]|nr:tetratricopeptide repeat protein [Gaiellaceae bacterium]